MTYKCSSFCSFYKGEKYIEGYMKDVIKQTIFKDIEFIFLDCNSPENEKDFILPYVSKYENIKYYKLDQDPGLYPAWNEAIELCSSPIIGNWNIDDRKCLNSFEILLKAFDRDPLLDVAYGWTYVTTIANETYEDNSYNMIYPCLPHSFQNLLKNNSPHCMPLWKKDLHDKYGFFDENYKTASDADFWLRCASGGARIQMVAHPVGLYFENPTGRSTNPETLKEMVLEVQTMRQKYIGVNL
jgi:hypothetical protein